MIVTVVLLVSTSTFGSLSYGSIGRMKGWLVHVLFNSDWFDKNYYTVYM